MKLQLIRNATLRLTYNGHLFIIDPYLAAKHSLPSYVGTSPNPLVDLPCTPEEVLAGVEMAIISHLHSDHFDSAAQELLPKSTPIFCQPGDEAKIAGYGFENVTPVETSVTWQGISLTRTPGQHGTGEWIERLGKVSGFILRAEAEPTVYWMGDTIWYDGVARVVAEVQPDVIITHASGAKFGDSDPIVMDAAQTIAVCRAAPQATVIAVHLESLDHGTVSRADLRAQADAEGITADRLRIPADGETLLL
ncbi:MAG: MBL fold metallo-hydrolase [Anaerolineae bacterium]|nr:MBL fold metallo-hydrolase [Anaerolineae bacterium]